MLSDESPANPFKSGTFFGEIPSKPFSFWYVSMLTNRSDENLFGLEYHIEVLASINWKRSLSPETIIFSKSLVKLDDEIVPIRSSASYFSTE